jgi:hypothetical protein
VRPAVVLLAVLATGCVGSGEGWVTGTLYVSDCLGGQPLDRKGDFDLHLDFFTGDPVEDANVSPSLRRNSLTLRLQNSTNNIEASDGLVLEFQDLGSIVQSVVQGVPVPVTNRNLCTAPCPVTATDQVRARLYLHASCPTARVPLLGSNQEMAFSASSPSCLMPTGKDVAACPTPKPEDKPLLDSLCAGKFNDRAGAATLDRLLGGGACIYLCQLGRAKPGSPPVDPMGFNIDFGDRVAALLAMNVVDGRAVEYGSCASATGQVRGMFAFNVARGHSAQTFP